MKTLLKQLKAIAKLGLPGSKQLRHTNTLPLPLRWLVLKYLGLTTVIALSIFCAETALAAVTITRTSSPIFYMNDDESPALRGMYTSYQITNTGGALNDVWVKIDLPAFGTAGRKVTRAQYEDGLVQLGPMAAGETKTAFFYVYTPQVMAGQNSSLAINESHNVIIYNTRPDLPTATQLGSSSFSFTEIQDTINANANKVDQTTVSSGQLGGDITVTVSGNAGTIGSPPAQSFSPAVFDSWPADTFELVSSNITYGSQSFNNQLLFQFLPTNSLYTARYTFRIRNTTTTSTPLSPVGEIASGTQVKHTSTSNFATLTPIPPISNNLTLSKSVNSTQLSTGGTVTYTLRLTNAGTTEVVVQDIVDTLPSTPAAATYITNTAKYNNLAIANPNISGSTLTWVGSFSVPAGATRDLTYQVNIPNTQGTYTNSAVAHIGSAQIDTTLDTSDNAPASVNVAVGTLPPTIDLDGNNSSGATGNNFTTNFTLGGSAVKIVDSNTLDETQDTVISDPDSTQLSRAVIDLTNVQTGDQLSVNGSLPSGISIDSANSTSTKIVLVGNASLANYESALEQIQFNTTSTNTSDRLLNITVTDTNNQNSNTAVSTVKITVPVTTNISGTLYLDSNANNSFDSGEPTLPANVTVKLLDSTGTTTLTTTTTNASGQYSFLAVASGSYKIQVDTADPDIPTGLFLTTPNNLSVTTSGTPVTNQNFGFRTPDLTITKTHSGNFTQGQTGATYTLTATNSGGAATSGTVTVTDTLPTGLTPTAAIGDGWTCNINGQTVTCTRSDALAAASNYPAITLTVNVAANAGSTITNIASVSGGGETKTDNNSDDDSTTIDVAAPPSICSVAGGNLGTNLFTNNGSFGTTTGPAGTVGSPLPAGRTSYSFLNNFPPNDGFYTIINQPSSSGFNAWYQPFDHTTGNLTGNMMVVNASFEPGAFYQETLNVTSNTNYEFSAWIINILKPQNAGIDPNIAFEVDRIGVDDDNNPNTADGSEGQIIITSGNITESASPTWLNYGTIINSGAATQMIVRFRNNAPGGGGNDLAIDDLVFAPCTPLPSGNISGTLYGDSNTNANFDSGEPRVKAGVLVQLINSSNAIVATTQTDNSGNYLFQNIPLGNYTIKVVIGDPKDPDLQGATPSSPSSAQLSASLTTAGQNLNNKNFGFTGVSPQPYLLLVKRITAINGNRTQNPNDATALDTFVNDPSTTDDNSKWSTRSTYLKGAYDGGKVKPGDEVEYTIYFLNTEAAAKNVTLCDRIPDNMTLVPTGYNAASPHPTESGAIPTDTGIGFALNASTLPTNPTAYLTNVSDSDRGRYYPPYDPNTPSTCKVLDAQGNQTASGAAANTNGAVVVEVVKNTDAVNQLPPATSAGTPTNSYGFIRFKAKVN